MLERLLVFNNQSMSIKEYCQKTGLNPRVFCNYVYKHPQKTLQEIVDHYEQRRAVKWKYDARFYNLWYNMKDRCYNPKNCAYKWYGEKGIKVYEKWHLYTNFRDDMYESYLKHVEEFGKKDTTIDRINFNGDYEPSNVRWATFKEQARNRSTNVILSTGQTLVEVCDERGLDNTVVWQRLFIYGWDEDRALNTKTEKKYVKVSFLDDGQTLKDYCREHNLNYSLILARLNRGWSEEDALNISTDHTIKASFLEDGQTLADYCRKHNKNYNLVRVRLNNGWSEEDALNLPSRCKSNNI